MVPVRGAGAGWGKGGRGWRAGGERADETVSSAGEREAGGRGVRDW